MSPRPRPAPRAPRAARAALLLLAAPAACAGPRVDQAPAPPAAAPAPVAVPAPASPAAPTGRPYVVTDTSVREGAFAAVAPSRDTIVSTYPRAAREVHFRFSIDGLENEFPPGTDHTVFLRPTDGRMTTPLYTFGVESAPPPPVAGPATTSEEGTARVTFRVDLGHVKRAIADSGRWMPRIGEPVTRRDFRVYVRGTPEPLTWDLEKLVPGSVHELTDPDGDGIYTGTVPLRSEYTRPRTADGRAIWARSRDVAAFPQVESDQRLQDALYRMSLEELTQLVRDDGALMAGAKWPGVWTRDISLAGILSLAIVAPDALKASLLAKVDSAGRIIQDTGTGGSWPVSSDRMVWALAAWELYAATGDTAWLRRAHDVTRRSALADLHAVRDEGTGLFFGESSFLDWREQSYPRWMQPADIYRSQNLGTNAIHFGAYRVLARMARALGEPAAEARRWDAIADSVAAGLSEHLWDEERGWFAQYRYGRVHLAPSPRAESLGESLAAVYGAATAEQRRTLGRQVPVVDYGAPTFWPFIPGERFYHNAAIWPFVTAYATWAAAEGNGTTAVRHGLDANARAAALFLTNKENMVASTGNYEGTALNSDRQLWSVAGTIAGTYRVLLGMRLEPDRLTFRPMVPPSYGGTRTLTGLRYRGMTLDVTVRGHGDAVASAALDGRPIERAEVPATLTGAHRLEITMNGRWAETPINVVEPRFAPATPRAALDVRCTGHDNVSTCPMLRWSPVPGAVRYVVHVDGDSVAGTRDSAFAVAALERRPAGMREWQVLAVNAAGDRSFLSEPVRREWPDVVLLARPASAPLEREHRGYTGDGYVRLERTRNVRVEVPVSVQWEEGWYAIDVRYANGSGPVNTDSKAAVRTLLVDGDTAGVIVMPQRGVDAWSDWGWSNPVVVRLAPGAHRIELVYGPLDANMDVTVNTALLDHVRLVRLAEPPR